MLSKIINTLKELLKYYTHQDNPEAFEQLFSYIKKHLNSQLYYQEYTFNNKKSLVISNTKEYELDIIFGTHIDVVPIEDYTISEDKENIYGRGTIDMKGSVAVLLELFNNLNTSKKVALFITSDEEIDGNCTKELLKIYHSSLAIIPDGGTNFNLIKEEKGLLQLEVSIQTKSAHSSQPFNGENAIVSLYNIYQSLISKYPLPQSENDYRTSINLSILNGGTANNQVPSKASMVLDIRHIAKDSKKEIIAFIKKLNSKLSLKILLEGPVFKTSLKNDEIQRFINISQQVLKRPIKVLGCESTSDAVYFSEHNIPTIIMNPEGYYAHCQNEYVNKKSLYKLYKIYEKFLESGDNNE